MNWRWPATKKNNLMPWYRIILSFSMLPIYILGVFLCCSAIAVVELSYSRAKELWNELI